jgi:hypothetical protein
MEAQVGAGGQGRWLQPEVYGDEEGSNGGTFPAPPDASPAAVSCRVDGSQQAGRIRVLRSKYVSCTGCYVYHSVLMDDYTFTQRITVRRYP